MKDGLTAWIVAVISFAAMATPARATPLSPGSNVAPDPVVLSGTTLVTSINGNFVTTGNVESGTYKAYVYKESAGTLDFVYQFTNSSQSKSALERSTMYDFTNFTTDVSFYALGGKGSGSVGVEPTSADRTIAGDTVAFGFLTPGEVAPGGASDYLVIKTNATQYTSGLLSVQDGATATVEAFAPTGMPIATPEPATIVLAGIGALCALGARCRRGMPKLA